MPRRSPSNENADAAADDSDVIVDYAGSPRLRQRRHVTWTNSPPAARDRGQRQNSERSDDRKTSLQGDGKKRKKRRVRVEPDTDRVKHNVPEEDQDQTIG